MKTNVEHCGKVNRSCSKLLLNAEGIQCADGKCTYEKCKEGYADADGAKENGCETKKTDIDVEGCGEEKINCNKVFEKVKGVYCAVGKCVYDNCQSGFADLSGNFQSSRGCVRTEKWGADKCGVGKVDCDEELKAANGSKCISTYPNDGAVIELCDYDSCKPYFYDMDNSRSNGCETFYTALIDPRSCGPKENDCFETVENVAGAVYCAVEWSGKNNISGELTFSCAYETKYGCIPGYQDADKELANGCEVAVER